MNASFVLRLAAALALCTLLSACGTLAPVAPVKPAASSAELRQQVIDAERAFARTMADRDHAAFAGFIADDTIFYSPKAVRGKAAVVAAWKRFYDTPAAPFSWEPEEVEVLDSGVLAISSGPVKNAKGELIATFTSIWRREANGQWRVIFDKGNNACEKCAKPAS